MDIGASGLADVMCRLIDPATKMSPDQWLAHRMRRMSTSLATKNVDKRFGERPRRRRGMRQASFGRLA
ncbi:hypothetical protein C7S17_4777 [Burkholderia thailandensis]|nr:hypothetical protein [Burkholderia thailandensis]